MESTSAGAEPRALKGALKRMAGRKERRAQTMGKSNEEKRGRARGILLHSRIKLKMVLKLSEINTVST